ncbi:hypothetical protein ATANTOWER_021906 [Ataeniobius toweri]|uniref:Uncharacterized protein n=1 Tax=Ataeniobius toweri TaxID=208326 RepID=A0ABU7AI06_9TELE|nr:hypothetical protein [Ataeniobius toweri]
MPSQTQRLLLVRVYTLDRFTPLCVDVCVRAPVSVRLCLPVHVCLHTMSLCVFACVVYMCSLRRLQFISRKEESAHLSLRTDAETDVRMIEHRVNSLLKTEGSYTPSFGSMAAPSFTAKHHRDAAPTPSETFSCLFLPCSYLFISLHFCSRHVLFLLNSL